MEPWVLDQIRCRAEDAIMGAKCTLLVPHDLPHKDESDPECVFSFREDPPELIVPEPGTSFGDLDVIERTL